MSAIIGIRTGCRSWPASQPFIIIYNSTELASTFRYMCTYMSRWIDIKLSPEAHRISFPTGCEVDGVVAEARSVARSAVRLATATV